MKTKKANKKSNSGIHRKIDRWLFKNSIIYRTGKKLIGSRAGLLIAISIIAIALIYFINYKIAISGVTKTIYMWVEGINQKKVDVIRSISDYSDNNPYRITLPNIDFVFQNNSEIDLIDIKRIELNFTLSRSICHLVLGYTQDGINQNWSAIFRLRKVRRGLLGKWRIFGIEVINE